MSDPKLWEAFYKNMAEGKFNPYKYRPKQKEYRIPVQPNAGEDAGGLSREYLLRIPSVS